MGSKDVQNHIPWPLLFFPHPRPHLGKSYLECPQFPSVKTKVCREGGGQPRSFWLPSAAQPQCQLSGPGEEPRRTIFWAFPSQRKAGDTREIEKALVSRLIKMNTQRRKSISVSEIHMSTLQGL